MATDFSKPIPADAYATLLAMVKTAMNDLACGLDPLTTGTHTSVPNKAIRWTSASSRWEAFNGTSWGVLSTAYGINISGNAATATTASACSGNSATATTASACSGNSATASACYGTLGTSSVASAFAFIGGGAVGSVALMLNNSGFSQSVGNFVSGSSLRFSGVGNSAGYTVDFGAVPPGLWQCMGSVSPLGVTVFVRYA